MVVIALIVLVVYYLFGPKETETKHEDTVPVRTEDTYQQTESPRRYNDNLKDNEFETTVYEIEEPAVIEEPEVLQPEDIGVLDGVYDSILEVSVDGLSDSIKLLENAQIE